MSSLPPSSGSSAPALDCLDANTAIEFIEGLCTPEQVAAIQQHVDGCALCRQLLSELARDTSPPEPPIAPPGADTPGPAATFEERLIEARLERGRSVGRYMLLDRLGAGGMGVVYSAYDPELNRKVALKMLRVSTARSQESQTRMLREAQAMARLQHPNVLAVFDAGTFGEEVFIAMELVEGSTLTQWLAAGKRSWSEVLRVFLSAGRGLAAAHAAGLIHRDFKPDNVLIRKDGRVSVTDFGLARDVGAAEAMALPAQGVVIVKSEEQLTRTGALLGTPAYMAPEQFLQGAVDARTDQFSFCVSLYEALYGERPFPGETWEALRQGVLGHQVRAVPRGVRVPPWLRRVLLRGVSPEPGSRFASMEQLLTQLERGPQAVRRRRAAAAALLAFMGFAAVRYHGEQQRREKCQGAALRFEGVWDAARKKTLAETFLATQQSYAPDAWAMTERTLDGYTARWTWDWTEACEATWVAQEQPEPLMRRRHQCLERSLDKVKAVTDLLAQASTAEVREAAHLIGTLPDLDTCSVQAVQPAEAPAPGKPVPSSERDALQTQLARVEALQAARRYPEGLEQARAVYTRARELGDRPLEAEGLLWQGLMHQGLQENKQAERLLLDAALAAEALGLDELKARAQVELVWLYGINLHQLEQAVAWSRQAQATLERLGGSPQLLYPFHRNLGGALLDAGKYAEATEHFLKARELAAQVLGEDHPRMMGMWSNAGMGLGTLDRYEEATEAVRHAVSLGVKWLGPRHPQVASTQVSLVLLLLQQQRVDEALPLVREAIATYASLGKPGTGEARARMFLGHIHLKRQEYAQARQELERSLAIARTVYGPEAPELADALTGIGEVLLAQGKPREALVPIQQALELQVQALGPKHFALGDTLVRLGKAQLALGQRTQAAAQFERVLLLQDIEQNVPIASEARFALAQVLEPRPEQRERALGLARQALEFYSRHPWDAKEKAGLEALLTRLAPPASR
jgi:tetratricopeptide (TPR) repeat protein/predicted Ser/Thr protein kinase